MQVLKNISARILNTFEKCHVQKCNNTVEVDYYINHQISDIRQRFCSKHLEILLLDDIKNVFKKNACYTSGHDYLSRLIFKEAELSLRVEIGNLYGGSDFGHEQYIVTEKADLQDDLNHLHGRSWKCLNIATNNYKTKCIRCYQKFWKRRLTHYHCKTCIQCRYCGGNLTRETFGDFVVIKWTCVDCKKVNYRDSPSRPYHYNEIEGDENDYNIVKKLDFESYLTQPKLFLNDSEHEKNPKYVISFSDEDWEKGWNSIEQ